MGRGADEALATPEDRAKCATLTGTAQADCLSDARRQREAEGAPRSSTGSTSTDTAGTASGSTAGTVGSTLSR